jgi:hypothetical protein
MSAKLISSCLALILLLMLFAFRRIKSTRVVYAAEEQALIVTIPLRSGDMGDAEERKHILALEDQLSAAIKESRAGEFDGDEFGKRVCTIYMYGPSAERLFSVTRPILKKFRPPAGSYVIKRYGKPGSKQDRVAIDVDETPPR